MTVASWRSVTTRAFTSGPALLTIALAPAMAAIWSVGWFVPQDAPAHVYNAEILARSFDPASPLTESFAIRWQPIPNWIGHLLLAGLVRIVPAPIADRMLTSLTLAGFAASVLWLRNRIAGARDASRWDGVPAAALSALLAMNLTWLLGFTSFALGSCLFPITLGYWWPRRDRMRVSDVVGLGLLLVLGYFCHLVSLGLTLMSLGFLAIATPMPVGSILRGLFARLLPLGLAAVPIFPLGFVYLGIANRSGPMRPVWENLADPSSLLAWKAQLSWADPITLMRKDALPFTDLVASSCMVLAPVFWFSGALIVWVVARRVDRIRWRSNLAPDRLGRGWWMLATLLIVGGVIGPDTMGPQHGNYLPQRVVLFGLVAAAVTLRIDPRRRTGRVATAGLVVALALQSAIVWDYALYSDRTAGAIVRAREDVGRGRRVAFVAGTIRSRFRSNPMMHVDNWLGVDTDNIIWGNYETLHYYFPVQFREGLARPSPEELEEILITDAPCDADRRARQWADLLARNADAIDVLVTYRDEPLLDAVSSRFFREERRRGDVRVLIREPARVVDGPSTPRPASVAVAGPLLEE